MNIPLAFKVALPMVLASVFIMVSFIAIEPDNMTVGFFVVLFFICVFVFFYGFSTGQKVAFPVKKLLKRAIDLSQGDLKSRFYMETKDEFGELAQIFNKIADELEASKENKEKSEQTVDIKVKARTQELEETIGALEQKVKNRTAELERKIEESEAVQREVEDLKKQMAVLKPKAKTKVKKEIQEVE